MKNSLDGDIIHFGDFIRPSIHDHGRTVGSHDDLDVRVQLEHQSDELLLPFEVETDLRLVHEEHVSICFSPAESW